MLGTQKGVLHWLDIFGHETDRFVAPTGAAELSSRAAFNQVDPGRREGVCEACALIAELPL